MSRLPIKQPVLDERRGAGGRRIVEQIDPRGQLLIVAQERNPAHGDQDDPDSQHAPRAAGRTTPPAARMLVNETSPAVQPGPLIQLAMRRWHMTTNWRSLPSLFDRQGADHAGFPVTGHIAVELILARRGIDHDFLFGAGIDVDIDAQLIDREVVWRRAFVRQRDRDIGVSRNRELGRLEQDVVRCDRYRLCFEPAQTPPPRETPRRWRRQTRSAYRPFRPRDGRERCSRTRYSPAGALITTSAVSPGAMSTLISSSSIEKLCGAAPSFGNMKVTSVSAAIVTSVGSKAISTPRGHSDGVRRRRPNRRGFSRGLGDDCLVGGSCFSITLDPMGALFSSRNAACYDAHVVDQPATVGIDEPDEKLRVALPAPRSAGKAPLRSRSGENGLYQAAVIGISARS